MPELHSGTGVSGIACEVNHYVIKPFARRSSKSWDALSYEFGDQPIPPYLSKSNKGNNHEASYTKPWISYVAWRRSDGVAGIGAATAAAKTQHRRHHGRRHRHVEYRRLPSRYDGGPDAEPRQDRQGRHVVHGLLCRGQLHGGSRELHHRRAPDPHRHDHGWSGWRVGRSAGRSGDHCDSV